MNIAEYFHAIDPSLHEGTLLEIESDEEGRFLRFSLRNAFPVGASLTIEHSLDLPSFLWNVLPGVQFDLIAETSEDRIFRARLPAFISEAERGFFRLRYN